MATIHNSKFAFTVQFVQQRHTVASSLEPLCTAITNTGLDADVLSEDRRRRYDYMESVKRGLDVPIILVTYSAGGNYGLGKLLQITSTLPANH